MKRETVFSLIMATLVCCVILIFAGGLELYFRYEHQQLKKVHEGCDITIRTTADPGLIYEHIPHASPEINAFGFRDVEHTQDKPADRCRIVIIGDSVATGQFVDFDAMFSRQLQHMLDAETPGRYEVILTAMTGYSTSQELVLLQQTSLRFKPDLIIWSYCLNDPAHPLYHDANGELGPYFYEPRSFLWYALKRKWFLIKESIRSIGLRDEFHTLLHELYWDQVEKNLTKVASICRTHKIPVVLAIVPVFEASRLKKNPQYVLKPDKYSLMKIHKDLYALGERLGMHPLDLLGAFSRRPMAELMRDPKDPWHPNALGHKLIAKSLNTFIRQEDLLSRCP